MFSTETIFVAAPAHGLAQLLWREPAGHAGQRPRHQAVEDGRAAELGDEDVGVLLRDHLIAGLAEQPQRDLVRHRRGGDEDRLLLTEQLGRTGLELVHGRVLAALLVAHLGGRNGGAHLRRRLGLGVRTEIDHQTPFGASTAAAAAGSSERSGCSSNR